MLLVAFVFVPVVTHSATVFSITVIMVL
jgi:hypothetical protein